MASVLNDIKKLLAVEPDYNYFDADIIIHINSILMALNQLGINTPVRVVDETQTWEEILPEIDDIQAAKDYIYLRVRVIFDAPSASFVLDAYDRTIKELEFRLNIQAEQKDPVGVI